MIKSYLIFLCFTCACIATQAQVNIITTIAGNDTAGYNGDNRPAINAELSAPEGLWLDKYQNIIIADAINNRIRKIDILTGIITTIAGTGVMGYNGDNIPATNAELNACEAVSIDTTGNIYIADGNNYRVRKINISTGIITTIAGTGSPGSIGDGGPATNAEMQGPSGLCFDRLGNLYIADFENYRIRKVAVSTGIITTFAGNGTNGYSGDNGPATAAQTTATEVFADSINNIYLADQFNNVIRRVDAVTDIITTIAGTGVAGYSGDNGPATNAQLNQPTGIYIDKQHNIFIAEYWNGTVRKISTTGIITTVAGTGVRGYSGDNGPATNAELRCSGVFLDSSGIMYIADIDNNRIRKVFPYSCTGAPVASFTVTPLAHGGGTGYKDSFTYTGTPYLIDSIKWSFGDGSPAAAGLNPVHTYTEHSTYRVCVTVYTYCGVDSVCSSVESNLGVASPGLPKGEEVLRIWPNPVSNELHVDNAANSDFYVYDLIGREVYKTFIPTDKEVVNISALQSGVYVVQMVSPATGQRTISKIIKE